MILGIIPARGGSKGLVGKNLYPVTGKPLLAWTLEQAKNSIMLDDILVSSDSDEILALAHNYSVSRVRRPPEISRDSSSTEEALIHGVAEYERQHGKNIDEIVLLQATSPLRKDWDIDEAIKTFRDQSLDSLFSASKLNDLTVWNKDGDIWRSINFDYKNRLPRQNAEVNYVENGSIYICKKHILEKYANRLGGNIGIYLMKQWQTWEIDTLEDIELIEFYMNRYMNGE